jgi:hypothetical protein
LWQRARNDFSWNKTSPSIIQTRCLAAIWHYSSSLCACLPVAAFDV